MSPRISFLTPKSAWPFTLGISFWFSPLAGGIILLGCLILYLTTDQVFSIPTRWILVIPVLSVMSMTNTINLTVFRMQGKALRFGIYEVVSTSINIGITILLLVAYDQGWYSRVYGIALAWAIFALIALWELNKNGMIIPRFDTLENKSILNISLPLIPHTLGGIVIALSDRLFIERMVGLEEVGIYTVGYMFGMILLIFSESFLKAWNPWFFKKIETSSGLVKRRIVQYTYFYILALILLGVFVSAVSYVVLPFMVEESYLGAQVYIPWVAAGYFFFGLYQIFFPYLVTTNRTSFLSVSTTVAAVLNLGLNYILIREYGEIGAAYATIIAFSVSSLLVFGYSNKHFPMPWLGFLKNQEKENPHD